MNLRLLIVRSAGALSIERADTAFHRAPGLFERLGPGSAHLHDLRPIGEAVSSEHDQLRLSVAPAMQGRGPLARSVERIDPLAARDRVAIDEPRHQWCQLTRGRGDHRLVHQGQSFVEAAQAEQGAPLYISSEGDEVRFPEALAELGGAGG